MDRKSGCCVAIRLFFIGVLQLYIMLTMVFDDHVHVLNLYYSAMPRYTVVDFILPTKIGKTQTLS